MGQGPLHIGIDLGGTKIELAAFTAEGRECSRKRIPTPVGDYQGTCAAISDLILSTEQHLGRRGTVGLGIPGAWTDPPGLVKNANSTCLIGRPLKRDLESLLHREIRIANDANCFALSEAVDGAGQGAEVVFGVILGTGVGGGIVVRGEALVGANAIAGEWGHNPLPFPSPSDLPLPACYCGRLGCIETYLSGPGLSRDHRQATGQALDPREIVLQAEGGDSACLATLERYEERLARGLAHVINILDPQVIVLGGGLSHLKRLYENVPRLWGPNIFSDRVATRLLPNQHGDAGGVRGAAWLWTRGGPS